MKDESDNYNSNKKQMSVLNLITIGLITLKLAGKTNMSWKWVLLPSIIDWGLYFLSLGFIIAYFFFLVYIFS